MADPRAQLNPCSRPNSDSALADPPQALTHYAVVRADLSRGLQAANLVHAAGESSPGDIHEGTHAVVLTVPDEAALLAVAARLEAAGVAFVRVVETDAPYHGQTMALGLRPGRKEVLRRYLSALPLLR